MRFMETLWFENKLLLNNTAQSEQIQGGGRQSG